MARELGPRGVRFAFIYTREAHPAENHPAHRSMEQKIGCARAMVARWNIERPMLVDDLEGTVHRAFGMLPNMAYVVNTRGRIVYKANWTDARTLRLAAEQELWQGDREAGGARVMPYTVEWQPSRLGDRPAFLAGLLENGPRAVEEFIAAAERSWGDGAPLREMKVWWAAHR